MKHLSFIKISPHVNLLHLYEHVICIRLHATLRSKGYYCYVDYALKGRTFDAGFAWIDIEVYTPALLDYVKDINGIVIDATHTPIIQAAFAQLLAEAQTLFRCDVPLPQAVSDMHTRPWLAVEDMTIVELPKNSDSKHDVLIADMDTPRHMYTGRITLGNKHVAHDANLLPLLMHIALAVGHNVQVHISNAQGYYRESLRFAHKKIVFKNYVAHTRNDNVAVAEDSAFIQELIEEMKAGEVFERLRHQLRAASHHEDIAADIEHHTQTGVLIGKEGWRAVATASNVQYMLENITFSLVHGGKARTLHVGA